MTGPADEPPRNEPRTIILPGAFGSGDAPELPPAPAPPLFPPPPPPGQARAVREGDVLNHLYQVRRRIARGGMGEVFEGVNITNEYERVAIKVILPHLTSDPKILALFRREARTLTRLSHPALVQYRTLAQEPVLGLLYIVTEFIDGRNLSDLLGTLRPGAAEAREWLRLLAEGLAVAHRLGAIHRDISPDNIMLEGGRLDRPKVIDFGIAKDLDPGSGTIVGTGFAGKLNYVAPEQLGAFGGSVGPWTDVYGLGLTALALLGGRDVNMGGSLVEAVDKRRQGPDLAAAPPELRGVLEAMLRGDPQDRLRSMDAVLAALAAAPSPRPAAEPAPLWAPVFNPPPPTASQGTSHDRNSPRTRPVKASGLARKRRLIAGGVALGLLVAGGLGFAVRSGGDKPPPPAAPAPVPSASVDTLAAAQSVLQAGLGQVGCAWLDVTDLQVQGREVALALHGVAGDPAGAQNRIAALFGERGLQAASLDLSDVQQINANDCDLLEAFRAIRAPGGGHVTPAQQTFEMAVLPAESNEAGKIGAAAVVNLDLNGIAGDFAVVTIEDSGALQVIKELSRALLADPPPGLATARPGVYRLPMDTTHKGWSGIVLLTGKGPFDPALFDTTTATRRAGWLDKFRARAKAQGWQAEMTWYKTEDRLPNGPAPTPARGP